MAGRGGARDGVRNAQRYEVSKLVLFGLGRGADVAYRFLCRDTEHEIAAFAVDGKYIDRATFHGKPVVPWEDVELHYPPDDYRALVLIGYQRMNDLRRRKYLEAKAKGYVLESYVASNVFRVEDLCVGENCFILDNQSISLDVTIGNNVVMWSSNHIGDLSTIADHAWVSSHVTVAGNVRIGERAFLGIGATISNGITVADATFIGADVLVTDDTRPGSVHVAGRPGDVTVDSGTFMRIMMAKHRL
jgi:acetyltransferase-like isoleucine patch superfamily enzyme